MDKPIIIRVRQANNTYAATHKGQRATATAGPHAAARRVAEKIYGESSFVLSDAGIDNSDNTKGAQHCFRVELKEGEA
ncbi:hypothetical protein [Halomonas sp.]|uniref:hypothetical protein n=1 Tax=Halomonas sp. TaxID=1486246 RepID=UPI00298E7511|nr:hypothetical protein [Halomonas sp.]MDW7746560.1 hypothetical protein [Halomonas sp.]